MKKTTDSSIFLNSEMSELEKWLAASMAEPKAERALESLENSRDDDLRTDHRYSIDTGYNEHFTI